MALRFLVVFSVFVILTQGSLLHGDLDDAEIGVPQEGYLPVEEDLDLQSHHSDHHGEVLSHHHGIHHAEPHHHVHGSHHHLAESHHLPESHHHVHGSHHHLAESHHLPESHHLVHGSHHLHHHLEDPHHAIHGVHHQHHHQSHHHQHHHHRNCHAIHCPRSHSPIYATDGHFCYKVENFCELAIANCLRRNELKPSKKDFFCKKESLLKVASFIPDLHHISHHECNHLPRGH
ncbi:hypothetical protein KR009_008447 [Drosophila setifemur]|nr:hypothetical protein KR009_008447 [Drosophila setifemur]